MAAKNKIAEEVVSKLEKCFKELKIKTETKSKQHEALIYGKFSLKKEKFNIVVHLQKEGYTPQTKDQGEVKVNDREQEDCAQTPNLNFQSISADHSYTQEEGLKIKREFLEEATKLLPKLNR